VEGARCGASLPRFGTRPVVSRTFRSSNGCWSPVQKLARIGLTPAVQWPIRGPALCSCLRAWVPSRSLRGTLKLFKGGPVRRSSPPGAGSYLANVGQEAPRRFSGYSLGLSPGATPALPASEALGCRLLRESYALRSCLGASNRQQGLKPDSCR